MVLKTEDDNLLSCQICLKQQDIAIVAMKNNITETALSCLSLHDIFASLLVVKLVSVNLFLVTKRLITSTMSAEYSILPSWQSIILNLCRVHLQRTFEAINMTNKYYMVGSHIRTTIIQIKFS